jgi:hypothetical protein
MPNLPSDERRPPATDSKSFRRPTSTGVTESNSPFPAAAPDSSAPEEAGPELFFPASPGWTKRSRRSFWPFVVVTVILAAAAAGWKFHADAEAAKKAAAEEKRTADQIMATAEREVAAALQQVRQAIDQAARSEVRAREAERAGAREIARIRGELEAQHEELLAQTRREAEEQTRKQLAPQLEIARAASLPGGLKIASRPSGADVYVDGRWVGQSPAAIEGLAPGRHAIKLAMPGHVPHELTAEVFGSNVINLGALELRRATGAVEVSSRPDQLEFRIRDSSMPDDAEPVHRGRTPATIRDLPTGDYVIQFRRDGWPDRTERVAIAADATASVATTFQPGMVRIDSSPAGATVLERGVLLGRTPLVLVDVPPRDLDYELRAPGFEPLRMRGKVVAGQRLDLNGTLLNLDRLVSVDEVQTPPRLYFSTPINLGRAGRGAPREITVSFVVGLDGVAREVKVLDRVHKSVEKRFLEAISKWKFLPGVSDAGYPVKVRMSMPVRIGS